MDELQIPDGLEWLDDVLAIEVDEIDVATHDKHSGTKDQGTKHKD